MAAIPANSWRRYTPLFVVLALSPGDQALAHRFDPVVISVRESATGQLVIEGDLVSRLQINRRCDEPQTTTRGPSVRCDGDLAGLRLRKADQSTAVVLAVRPAGAPRYYAVWPASRRNYQIGRQRNLPDYLWIGTWHVFGGIDHLLLICCLLALCRNFTTLLATISAFTVGHSATLVLAALSLLRLPQGPTEALIALSVLVVAARLGQQQPRADRHLWLLALPLGLLHGLGFASALALSELPTDHLVGALLLFNLGIELGQLAVVVAFYGTLAAIRPWPALRRRLAQALPLTVGSLAAFWLYQRVAAML